MLEWMVRYEKPCVAVVFLVCLVYVIWSGIDNMRNGK